MDLTLTNLPSNREQAEAADNPAVVKRIDAQVRLTRAALGMGNGRGRRQ